MWRSVGAVLFKSCSVIIAIFVSPVGFINPIPSLFKLIDISPVLEEYPLEPGVVKSTEL